MEEEEEGRKERGRAGGQRHCAIGIIDYSTSDQRGGVVALW